MAINDDDDARTQFSDRRELMDALQNRLQDDETETVDETVMLHHDNETVDETWTVLPEVPR